MRMRKRNTLVVLALLWAVLVVAVIDGARTGEVSTATTIALLLLLAGVVPLFWRLFAKARGPGGP